MNTNLLTAALLAALIGPAFAAPQTVTLSVPTMDCAVCPITVKKALTGVPGVSAAAVSFERLQATVTFDNARISVQALTDATKKAGYPSTLAAGQK